MADATLRPADRPSTTGPATPSHRLAWIDSLKVVTIAGVVVFHAATAYITDVAGWYYEARTTSQVSSWSIGAPGVVLALFLLGPLFLTGGALAAGSLARSGPRRFVRRRLVRLGVPLLIFVVFVDPLTDLVGNTAQGLSPAVWETVGPASEVRDVGPLWFVAALLTFSLLYAGWRGLVPVEEVPPRRRPGALVAAAAVLAAGAFLVRLRWPLMDETFLDLRFAQWPQAATLFAIGVLLGERGGIDRIPETWVRRAGPLACGGLFGVVLLGGVLLLLDGDLEPLLGGWHWPSALLAVLEAITAIGVSIWVVAHARRWWPRQGPLLARAGRGAYAAYVLHPLVLVTLSAAAHPWSWPPEAKFLLVAAAGVVGSFALGWAVTRSRLVARVL
jgi:glucans biosynthesis protein C